MATRALPMSACSHPTAQSYAVGQKARTPRFQSFSIKQGGQEPRSQFSGTSFGITLRQCSCRSPKALSWPQPAFSSSRRRQSTQESCRASALTKLGGSKTTSFHPWSFGCCELTRGSTQPMRGLFHFLSILGASRGAPTSQRVLQETWQFCIGTL